MRKLFLLFFIACFYSLQSLAAGFYPSLAIEAKANCNQPVKTTGLSLLHSMKDKEIATLIGRKLTVKEKIGLQLLRWRGGEPEPKTTSKKGGTAKTMGIISLAGLLVFPLATLVCGVLAIVYGTEARKEDPTDVAAKTGITMGIIALGALVLAILLVVAIITSMPLR